MLRTIAAFPLLLALACASASAPRAGFDYFTASSPDRDPWHGQVEEWQSRARRDRIGDVPAGWLSLGARHAGSPDDTPSHDSSLLRRKMAAFRADERRALARRINRWARTTARLHYRFEDDARDPAADYWPTFKELLVRNGDDCDGLDLIAYEALREFGFREDEVYRAILRRNRDRANHMATLWFEDRDDPWVLDVTGAIALEMRRFSELEGWTPTKVFNEKVQFTVRESRPGSYALVGE